MTVAWHPPARESFWRLGAGHNDSATSGGGTSNLSPPILPVMRQSPSI